MRQVEIVGIDAGGTFTDTFIIDSDGIFVSGKASSTPKQLADGHLNSLEEAMKNGGIVPEGFFPNIDVMGFGTTAIINTILTRSGIKTGAIVDKGFEKIPFIGRGNQSIRRRYSTARSIGSALHQCSGKTSLW